MNEIELEVEAWRQFGKTWGYEAGEMCGKWYIFQIDAVDDPGLTISPQQVPVIESK